MSDERVAVDPARSMKGLLSVAIQEAVHLALIDSCIPPDRDHSECGGRGCPDCLDGKVSGYWTREQRAEFHHDIYAIPGGSIAAMDPGALARNVACRLLGEGGWTISGVYGGNATPQEMFHASIARPDRDHIAEVAFAMGLIPTEDGMFRLPEDDGEATR